MKSSLACPYVDSHTLGSKHGAAAEWHDGITAVQLPLFTALLPQLTLPGDTKLIRKIGSPQPSRFRRLALPARSIARVQAARLAVGAP